MRRILILLLAVVRRRRLLLILLLLLLLIAAIRWRNLLLRLRGRLNGLRLMLLRLYRLLVVNRCRESYGNSTIDTKFRNRHRLAMTVRTDRKILRIRCH